MNTLPYERNARYFKIVVNMGQCHFTVKRDVHERPRVHLLYMQVHCPLKNLILREANVVWWRQE